MSIHPSTHLSPSGLLGAGAVAGVGTVHLSLTPSCSEPWSRTGWWVLVTFGVCLHPVLSAARERNGEGPETFVQPVSFCTTLSQMVNLLMPLPAAFPKATDLP